MAIQARHMIPPFESSFLESVAHALADTQHGLAGSEIGRRQCKNRDLDGAHSWTDMIVDTTHARAERLARIGTESVDG